MKQDVFGVCSGCQVADLACVLGPKEQPDVQHSSATSLFCLIQLGLHNLLPSSAPEENACGPLDSIDDFL